MRHVTLVLIHSVSVIACSGDPNDPKGDDAVTTGATSSGTTTGSGTSGSSTTGAGTTTTGGMNPTGGGGAGGSPGEPCAEPGAMGNDLGVGQYCQTDGDCDGLSASFCTVAHEPSAPPFCTMPCFGDGDCGQGATCEDNGGVLKGCVPGCLMQP